MNNDFKDLEDTTNEEFSNCYTDRTLRYKLTRRKEGIEIEIEGTDPIEGALMLSELVLFTETMEGYKVTKKNEATKGKYSKQEQYKLIRQRYAMRKRLTANK